MKRRLVLGICKTDDPEYVLLKIIEQTHRGAEFWGGWGERLSVEKTYRTHLISAYTPDFTVWEDDTITLYVRGAPRADNVAVAVPAKYIPRISEVVHQYNSMETEQTVWEEIS